MNKFLNEIIDTKEFELKKYYFEKEYPLGQIVLIDNESITRSLTLTPEQKNNFLHISEQKGKIEAYDKMFHGNRILIRWENGEKSWLEHVFLLTKIR